MTYKDKTAVIKCIPEYLAKFKEDIDYLNDIDCRLNTYIENVLNTPDAHNKYEILGVFRFLDFIDKYSFNVTKFKKFIRFYELLPFPSQTGQKGFKLTPIQVFQFANIYGFVKENGYRVCRNALLYVPRKFSKTTSVAACAIWDLMFGPPDAQAFVAANSFAQANDVCFKIIRDTLELIDPSMSTFRINRDKIYSKIPGHHSFIQCLSASPKRLDGLNASTIILDEYAAAPSAALKNVLKSSQGVRTEPLIITITTADTNLEGPFAAVDLPNYKKVLEGTIDNDTIFASIFEPDEGDDYGNPKTWKKVQPHMGITVREESYENAWKDACVSAEDREEFLTKLLNVFIPPSKTDWISPKVIERNTVSLKIESITTRPLCMVAVDLSAKHDFSCVSYGIYDSITKTFTFVNDYYIPENEVLTHTNTELYQRWVQDGHLKVCGKEVINYQQIAQDIINKSKYVKILAINYDSYKNQDLTNYLKAQGVRCLKPYRQVYSEFTSPIETFEIGIHEDRIKIDDNPINAYCIQNCVIDEDSMGNRKMIKSTANKKIDGAVCITMNLGAFGKWKR